ncbi:hypothetical protein ABIA96_007364 [Bradyrhizobium sp. LB11.1]
MFAGVNIDGANQVKVVQQLPDKWFFDGRVVP